MSFNYTLLKKSKNKSSKKKKSTFIKPPAKYIYPPLVERHMSRYGLSEKHYQYSNIKNETCFWIIRYDPGELKKNTKKVLVPMSFCKESNVWEKGSWTKDRPLYQENLLAQAKDDDEIVIVEGEKATKALNKYNKFKYVVTWSGGSNAVHLTDFSVLKNKKVQNDDGSSGEEKMNLGKVLRCIFQRAIKN